MANKKVKIDLEYFERGMGLILGQLEYLIEKSSKIDYKFVEDLTFKEQQFDVVEDDDEYQKVAAAFSDIRQNMVDDEKFKDDREIFYLVTEIDRLNNHLLILLTEKNGSQPIAKVLKYCAEQFNIKIRELLAMNEMNNVFGKEAVEILKILVNEKKFEDIEEGINLIAALTPLNEETKHMHEVLAEAHILVIYHDMLKQKPKK